MPQAFPPLSPEYDAFLYAVVCKEKNGMHLTMASAIARSGADPWNEAARISKMHKDAALKVLGRLISSHNCAEQKSANSQMTLDELFSLLPKARPFLALEKGPAIGVGSVSVKNATTIVAATLCIFAVLAYLISVMWHTPAPDLTQKPSDSAPIETLH
jgi:hypothetical protein